MSTKTIAIQSDVYEKLAFHKRGTESFTKTIARLLDQQVERGTCADALVSAAEILSDGLTGEEAAQMEEVLRQGHGRNGWTVEPLT